MAARLGIFLNWVFTVVAVIVAGLAAIYLMNHAKPMDQFEMVMLGLAFALAAALASTQVAGARSSGSTHFGPGKATQRMSST